jgi:hypothetical protein
MSVEVVDHEPVRPSRTQLRLGGRHHDLTTRAVVVGLLEVSAERVQEAGARAATVLRDGAAAVELAGTSDALHAVLSDLRAHPDPPGPLGCRVATVADLEVATTAEVDLITLADEALADALVEALAELVAGDGAAGGADAGARDRAPVVVATPEVLSRLRSRWIGGGGGAGGASRLVADPAASVPPQRPDAGAGSWSGAQRRWVPGALEPWVEGATVAAAETEVAVATTLAVLDGARLVRTTSVRPARRASDLVATLLQERWEQPG